NKQEEYTHSPIRSATDVIDDTRVGNIVLVGDPGLGKSTLLRWLALRWAETGKHSLPLLIELRRYVGDVHTYSSFLEFLTKGNWAPWIFGRRDIEERLKNDGCLVMFDGLDEASDPARRAIVVNEIIRFAREYPQSHILVTTRIVGYHPGSANQEEFR